MHSYFGFAYSSGFSASASRIPAAKAYGDDTQTAG